MDDDSAMGYAAFAAAMGDVGGHDDWHDAPVCLAYAAPLWRDRAAINIRIRRAMDLCIRGGVSDHLDRVQPGGNRTSAGPCGSHACFADDGNQQPYGRCRIAAGR